MGAANSSRSRRPSPLPREQRFAPPVVLVAIGDRRLRLQWLFFAAAAAAGPACPPASPAPLRTLASFASLRSFHRRKARSVPIARSQNLLIAVFQRSVYAGGWGGSVLFAEVHLSGCPTTHTRLKWSPKRQTNRPPTGDAREHAVVADVHLVVKVVLLGAAEEGHQLERREREVVAAVGVDRLPEAQRQPQKPDREVRPDQNRPQRGRNLVRQNVLQSERSGQRNARQAVETPILGASVKKLNEAQSVRHTSTG